MTQDEFYRHLGAFRKQWDESKDLFRKLYDQAQKMYDRSSPEDLERYSKQLTRIQDELAMTSRDASRLWLLMIGDMTDATYLKHTPQLDLAGKLEAPPRPECIIDFTPPQGA